MKQVLVRMPRELHDALVADAKRNDRTMAQTARRAIRLYLDTLPPNDGSRANHGPTSLHWPLSPNDGSRT